MLIKFKVFKYYHAGCFIRRQIFSKMNSKMTDANSNRLNWKNNPDQRNNQVLEFDVVT